MNLISKRPYLLRALFEWILDSELTPYILVDAANSNVNVPQQFVSDGKIVLNVSPAAVRNLSFDNDHVRFNGRFSGTPFAVEVPMAFVLAIYAKESGEGMMFDTEETYLDSNEEKTDTGPHLKIIK